MKTILKSLLAAFAIVATAAFAGAQSGNLGNTEVNGTDDSLKVWIGKDVTAYLQTMMKMRSTAKVTEIKRGSKSVDVMFAKNLTDYYFRDSSISRLQSIIGKYFPNKEIKLYVEKRPIEELASAFYAGKVYKMDKKVKKLKGNADESYKLVTPLSNPYTITKGLQKSHIAMWQSHGWYYDQPLQRWEWQRARDFQTVEDLYTQSYVVPFLLPMLENAGAMVLLPRERDPRREEVIVDNDANSSGYREENGTKVWSTGQDAGFANAKEVYGDGDNPFAMGTYRVAESVGPKELAKGAKASEAVWIANVPESGEYAVYISYKTLPNSSPAVKYKVKYSGGEKSFLVNQQMGGNTWICLGSFAFTKGDSKQGVYLTNATDNAKFASKKLVVTADGVKFGGGMGNIARHPSEEMEENRKSSSSGTPVEVKRSYTVEPQTSGYPRIREGARYWLQYAGFADSVYTYTQMKNDYNDDYMSRGKWVNALLSGSSKNPKGKGGYNVPIDLSLGFHTDAGTFLTDSIVGTLLIYTKYSNDSDKYLNGESRMLGREFADIMQTQLVEDVRAKYEPKWGRRQLWDRSYAESRIPEVPGVLLEFLSHQNFADMKYGLDPSFRFTASRAIYKAMLKFLAYKNGTDYVVQPLPVKNFAAILTPDSKRVQLSWEPVADELEPTAVAKSYVLYKREGTGGFDEGTVIEGTKCEVEIQPGVIYGFKVVALNEGGISFPSEILSVGVSASPAAKRAKVMIVNGFERVSAPAHFQSKDSTYAGFLDIYDHGVPYIRDFSYIGSQYEFNRSLEWRDDDAPGFGASRSDYEDKIIAGNTFDYPSVHGEAFLKAGYDFVSTSVGAVKSGAVSLDGYFAVDFIMGKQTQTKVGFGNHPVKYEVFPESLRKVIEQYANAGGNLLLSGAYIATDLWDAVNVSDQGKEFANKVLKFRWMTHSASVDGKVGSVSNPYGFKGKFNFYNQPNSKSYVVEAPDALNPVGENAYTIFRYSNTISAGVAYKGNYKSVVLGFPIETLTSQEQIDTLIGEVVEFFEEK